jgi:DNA-binding LacI/PurR family transcriptional regulator
MRKGKATSLEVAHLAGVSQPTVSRALRGSPTVNEETRRRIQAIADELNYKVDRNASKLRTQHTDTLALLFFEDPTLDDSLINPFFLSMLGSITRACALHGYDLLISFQQLSGNWLADYQDSKKADGIILLGYGDYIEYLAKLEQLIGQGTRFVRWGAVLPGQPGISIGCDNHDGGRSLARHLIEIGRRRIAFLGHASEHYPEFLERHRGYVETLVEHGLAPTEELHVDAVSTELSGYEAVRELARRGASFDALCCASDSIAIGAMRALQERGLRLPEDVTTVQQDTKLAGQLLVEALLALILDEPVASQVMPAKLIVRRSTVAA